MPPFSLHIMFRFVNIYEYIRVFRDCSDRGELVYPLCPKCKKNHAGEFYEGIRDSRIEIGRASCRERVSSPV